MEISLVWPCSDLKSWPLEHGLPLVVADDLLLHFCCDRCLLLRELYPFNSAGPEVPRVLLVGRPGGSLGAGKEFGQETGKLVPSRVIQSLIYCEKLE